MSLCVDTDYDDIARRKYKKVSDSREHMSFAHCESSRRSFRALQDMDTFKPDLTSYDKQRLAAQQSLALVASAGSADGSLSAHSSAAHDLYRDANSFIYADHKPSEDAIDRVIGKINLEYVLGFVWLRDSHDLLLTRLLGHLVSTRGKNGHASARTRTKGTLPTSTRRCVRECSNLAVESSR